MNQEFQNLVGQPKQQKKDGVDAPPPWHSALLMLVVSLASLWCFPSLESLDEVATVDTFTRVLFPDLMSLEFVASIRLMFSMIVLTDSVYQIFDGSWEQDTEYAPESKLKGLRGVPFRGIFRQPKGQRSLFRALLTQSPYTMWCWNVLGISNLLNGIIALVVAEAQLKGRQEMPTFHPWFLRIAVVLFEVAAPNTMLVSSVVRYALWPMALQQGCTTAVYKDPWALMEHNANIIMALIEVGFLGGLPIRLQDFALAPLFGVAYVMFVWAMRNHWPDPLPKDTKKTDGDEKDQNPPANNGSQFHYFFFDTTLGWLSTLSLVALLAILTFFYAVFAYADHFLSHLQGGPLVHLLAITITASLFCRFRD